MLLWVHDEDGNVLGTRTVTGKITDPLSSYYESKSTLTAGDEHIYATYEDTLYWYGTDDFADFRPESSSRFRFLPKQAMFCLKGQGQWEPSHTLLGGAGPFDFFDNYLPPHLENDFAILNETTGSVMIDGPAFLEAAQQELAQTV